MWVGNWLGDGKSDSTPPAISNISPAPGSTITQSTPLSFRITDDQALLAVLPAVRYDMGVPATGVGPWKYEVIHDGDAFTVDFVGTRVAVVGPPSGYDYVVTRIGGWPLVPHLVPFAFDTAGNEIG